MTKALKQSHLKHFSRSELIALLCHQSADLELLQTSNQSYVERIASLEQLIEELQSKLNKNSQNSSKPPSSDGYEKPAPKSRRGKSGKAKGGQVGHKGVTLTRTDTPDAIEIHSIDVCKHCGRDLSEVQPTRHECRQEVDVEPSKPKTTEHQAQIKTCPYCGHLNRGCFPSHITKAIQYGVQIKAISCYYSQYQFIPYSRLQEVFADCYSLSISQGSLVTFNKQGQLQIEPSIKRIKENLLSSEVLQLDESGIRVNAKLHWLHSASAPNLTYYHVHTKRGKEAIDDIDLLPRYDKTVVHDHWKPYLSYTNCHHGLCNAHHIRELIFAYEQHDQTWADKLIDCLLEIEKCVEEYRQKNKLALPKKWLNHYSKQYNKILAAGESELPIIKPPDKKKRGKPKQHKVKNLWDRLKEYKASVLLFMYDFRVPFTNNLAEQDIRMCKVKGKVSGGFRSTSGAEAFCQMRSYISTARKQDQNVLAVLRDAYQDNPFIPA